MRQFGTEITGLHDKERLVTKATTSGKALPVDEVEKRRIGTETSQISTAAFQAVNRGQLQAEKKRIITPRRVPFF